MDFDFIVKTIRRFTPRINIYFFATYVKFSEKVL